MLPFASLLLPWHLAVAPVPPPPVADPDPSRPGVPAATPAAVGMSASRLAVIDRVLQRGVSAGGFPGAAVIVGRRGRAAWAKGVGTLDWRAGMPVEVDATVYDLASLTKVVATTTALMVLFDEGKLALDAPVSRYLPEYTGGMRDLVTVRHLLTHRAGLPAGLELWKRVGSPAEARAAVMAAPIRCPPGQCFEYSDLGPDLLGFVVEAISGEPLDRFVTRRVFQPLGMRDTRFGVPDDWRPRTAPTEVDPPRGYPLRGEVHDENAFMLGGVAGHAGLFGTAADLAVFAQMLLEGGAYEGRRIVADSTVALFTRRTAGRRALGWDTCDGLAGCGTQMSPRAFGHTGYTGTSLWIDPDRDLFVVLLTNRVHAARARRPARVIADVRNDVADAAVLAVMDAPGGVPTMPASFRSETARDWNRPVRRARSRRGSARRAAPSARSAPAPAKASAAVAKKGSATTAKGTAAGRKGSAAKAKGATVPKKGSAAKAKGATAPKRGSTAKARGSTRSPS
ncbi:MAG: serine hydrolase [Gemmatimonadetes bacterium]|nr:serine hydrolase [Gemmatimonadota bacterium]